MDGLSLHKKKTESMLKFNNMFITETMCKSICVVFAEFQHESGATTEKLEIVFYN